MTKKLTWIYLTTYLLIGGIGFSFLPELTLKLFLSNGDYGDIMPRAVGMFMLVLGGLIGTMTFNQDFRYYPYAVMIRTGMIAFLLWLFTMSKDPLFLVITGIVLLGLLPSWYLFLKKADH